MAICRVADSKSPVAGLSKCSTRAIKQRMVEAVEIMAVAGDHKLLRGDIAIDVVVRR